MDKNSEIYKKIKSYRKNFVKFDRDTEELNFIPAHHINPKEEGVYVTIRCGLSGIYQMLNEWKNGKWQVGVMDDSVTIAFSRNKIEL